MKYTVLFFIFIKLLAPIWHVSDYIINYDYIAKNLCINKGNKELKCNGKCFLLKKIKGKDDNEKKKTISIDFLRFNIINTIDILQIPIVFFLGIEKKIINTSNILKCIFCIKFYHPPKF